MPQRADGRLLLLRAGSTLRLQLAQPGLVPLLGLVKRRDQGTGGHTHTQLVSVHQASQPGLVPLLGLVERRHQGTGGHTHTACQCSFV